MAGGVVVLSWGKLITKEEREERLNREGTTTREGRQEISEDGAWQFRHAHHPLVPFVPKRG